MSPTTRYRFTVVEDAQRSKAWFKARLGRLCGSRAGDMLSTIKTGEAAARRDLRVQLVVERLTATLQEDTFINGAMQWGVDHEADAFAAYEALTGNVAQRTGFLAHDTLMAGCSLDGHVDDFAGICEFKCPKSATHLKYLKGGKGAPSEHLPQITHNLWISGADWCDFLSFDPRFPAHLRTFLARVNRADVDLAGYAAKALAFLAEIDAEVALLSEWRA